MADQTTKFRLDQIEGRLKTLGDRSHDLGNMALDSKTRLDNDVQAGHDRENRLRAVEAFIDQQKGKEMQNRLIMGAIAAIVSIVGAGIVEVVVRHI